MKILYLLLITLIITSCGYETTYDITPIDVYDSYIDSNSNYIEVDGLSIQTTTVHKTMFETEYVSNTINSCKVEDFDSIICIVKNIVNNHIEIYETSKKLSKLINHIKCK
jgi:hypothetical protein